MHARPAASGTTGGRPSKATTSPSRIASLRAERRPEPAQLGVAGRDVVAVAALEPQPAAVDVADRPHAVPLDLVGPLALVARQLARAREHRLDALRHRLAVRILGRIHAVDHPVVAAGPEQHVAAVQALAVEGDHHLVVAELVRLVGPAVPDLHRPGAVLAGRDVAVEVDVLERVVLGVDRQVVARRDRAGSPSGRPTRRARRRARAAGPSADAGRGAPARRSARAAPPRPPPRPPGSGVASKSRLAR